MLHACAARFDVTENLEIFWILAGNRALHDFDQASVIRTTAMLLDPPP